MTRACVEAVEGAVGKGVFSEAEIADLLDRMVDRARRAKAEEPSAGNRAALARAAGEMTREELLASLTAKRAALYAEISTAARQARLDAMPKSLNEAQRLRAYDLGAEKQGHYTGASVDAEGRAEAMNLWGQVEIGLGHEEGLKERISNFWGFAQKEIDRKIAKEMARLNGDGSIEPTGDAGALHAAQVFNRALEMARVLQNDQGAWIQKLPGYIARQGHNRLKIAGGFWRELGEIGRNLKADGLKAFDWNAAQLGAAKRAFGEWRDFITPKLHASTFDGLELDDVPLHQWEDEAQEARQLGRKRDLEDARGLHAQGILSDPNSLQERMLYRVWMDIVTGQHEQLGGAADGDFQGPASKGGAVSKARVLHFQSPDAWLDYNAKYGNGSLFQTVMGQLERGARNAALMRRWGPNPDAARAAEIRRLSTMARARGAPDVVKKLNGHGQAADFDAINGRMNVPEHLRLAMIARGIRSWEAITKLGGIVLSKATDLPMSGHTMARAGAGFLKGYEGPTLGLLGLQAAEGKRAAELLHIGARSFAGHLTGQFNAADGALGWGSWAARLMYRLNLFETFNERIRGGNAAMYSRFLAQEAEHDWSGLQQGTRETFERFGIDAPAWELARQGLPTAPDGLKYFTLEHLDGIDAQALHDWKGTPAEARTPQGAAEARADLSLRLRAMIHNVIDDTTSEPRMREQRTLAAGARAGTIWGEAIRSFGQFKGFLFTIGGRHLAPAMQGYAGYSPVALIAHFIVASALAGYVSMNAKLIAKGQAPRPLVGADAGETAKIWAASLAQGGGLGIYGDFLSGEQNRSGLNFTVSSLGGPALSDLENVAQIVRQAVHGGAVNEATGQSRMVPELVRLGGQNIPLINLWYTRLAIDYIVLWRLQEGASPGYLQRYQNRVETEEGGHFIVPPTAAAN